MTKLYCIITLVITLFAGSVKAQNNLVTYAGGTGSELFNDVIQLSNGKILVIGVADNLNWINAAVSKIQLPGSAITNNQGTGKTTFILVFDSLLQNMRQVFYLPPGAAEDLRYIKVTNLVGQPTGAIYISGNTSGSGTTGGYFIGKLNNNFVTGDPTGFAWVKNVYAKPGSYPETYQPWDVGGDGKVIYAYGDSHDYDWSAVYRLKADGSSDVVPNWRLHYTTGGAQYLGSANNFPGGIGGISYSAIVFKRDGGRCELRSPNAADYTAWIPDGNGGTKRGKWPLDVLFNIHCVPGGSNTTNGKGYTGYSPSAIATYGPASICIDKRNNHIYIGFNAKSVLPDGNPDFEPGVMAMDETGSLKWWSRLYHEVTPAGDTVNSTPDQYVDALAIDYSKPANTGYLVVGARSHGNNVENLWEGNEIAANPGANGFQNRFTGNSGNIHLSWIGKLMLQSGTLMHSSYMGELAEGAVNMGGPSADPIMDGWPSPNSGFPTLNTTYLGKNNLKITADGSVLILGVGRRTITTSNAYQKMIKPAEGKSAWNNFVRLYKPELSGLKYSSLVAGQWEAATGNNGDNVKLYGVFKTARGIISVGQHTGSGGEMPVINVPAWGSANYNAASAVLAYYQSPGIQSAADNPVLADVILPVSITRFYGETINGKHHLNWETATEIDNQGFYTQKSADGIHFSNLGFVPAKSINGNSTVINRCRFIDENTNSGTSHYRILQADKNGRETASNIVILKLNSTTSPVFTCNPNPVGSQLNITIDEPVVSRPITIGIYDNTGRRLVNKNQQLNRGRNNVVLTTKQLAAGTYYVHITCNDGCEKMIQQIIKL